MFTGGKVPVGYVVKERKLVVSEPRRRSSGRSSSGSSGPARRRCWRGELRREGIRTKRGKLIDKGYL
jgi:hypothetical protein